MAYLGIPQNTIAVLQKYHFNFQKKFGQNFLIDTTVLDRIISSAKITKEDCVLEIGPGIGTMTQYLAERAGSVVAVEIDKALIPILEETLQDYDNVTVINDDILKVDINRLVEEKNGGRPIKVVANLPYYITNTDHHGLIREPCAAEEHHYHGAEGSGGPYAGRPRHEGLRRPVSGGAVLCKAGNRGECTAQLLHPETECGQRGHPPDPLRRTAGTGEG